MNERWERYLSCPPSAPPPLDTRRLRTLQARREQRRQLVLLCLASLLWTILALSLGISLWREGSPLGTVLLGLMSIGVPSGGLMAAALLKAEAKKTHENR